MLLVVTERLGAAVEVVTGAVGTHKVVTDPIVGPAAVITAVGEFEAFTGALRGQEEVTGAVGRLEVVADTVKAFKIVPDAVDVTDAFGKQEVATSGRLSDEILSVFETRFEI